MENALSTLSVMPETKAEITTFVYSFVEAAKNGYNEPLEVAKKVKILEETTKKIKLELKEYFQDDVDNFAEKVIEKYGCKFEKRGKPTYDYSICNDEIWNNLDAEIKQLTKMKKAREVTLLSGVDPETGVEFPNPKVKVTDYLAITIK